MLAEPNWDLEYVEGAGPGTDAWEQGWAALAAEALMDSKGRSMDPAQPCGCGCGEQWQNVGTFRNKVTGRVHVEFRHRHHPRTQRREYRKIAVQQQ